MSVKRLSVEEFNEAITEQGKSLFLYGTGSMCGVLMSGALDVLFGENSGWRDRIRGFIDRNKTLCPEFIRNRPFYTLPEFCEKEPKAMVLLCTGVAKRHRDGYPEVISELETAENNYELITLYDLMTEKFYYRECGVFEAAGIYKVLDMAVYLASAPWYFHQVFDRSRGYSHQSAKNIEKWISRCSAVMTRTGQIGMRDIRSGYFNVLDGRRLVPVASGNYKNRIHVFGDSRILSIRTNDTETITNYLQQSLSMDGGTDYRVLNYGMPLFSLERILYQILHVRYVEGDLLVVGGAIRQTLHKNTTDWNEFVEILEQLCAEKKLRLILLHCPCIYELAHRTYVEQFILDAFLYLMPPLEYAEGREWVEFVHTCTGKGILLVDMSEAAEERFNFGEIYVDTQHYGPNGNRYIAELLYKAVRAIKKSDNGSVSSRLLERSQAYGEAVLAKSGGSGLSPEEVRQLDTYLKECGEKLPAGEKNKITGAIVMNCNPFTKGHRYLIETAASRVDRLIVFVVEEDKSFFDFNDRFRLVEEGSRDLSNIFVLRSGRFMISALTFPEYFCKDDMGDMFVDSSADLALFGESIAPYFGITKRFVGEEPYDPVTRQYNETMREVLEDYGIQVEEIPRKEAGGAAISASRVRKLLEEGCLDKIKELVPDVTYCYLEERFGREERHE